MIYKCLNNQVFAVDGFKIVPIRFEDRFDILQWRNEQIYHLRQNKPLTIEDQDNYFSNVVSKLFEANQPNQILFSFLENEVCIGYGGLVHMNWIDKNAEISFIMKTEFESEYFITFWRKYLQLIEKVAFEELNFHKIFTYAFDLRPKLYEALLLNGFSEEVKLKEHCFFDNKYINVVIHSKINRNIKFRKANKNDLMLYFDWTNDPLVRENSYKTDLILLDNHKIWFEKSVNNPNIEMLVFENHLGCAIGQVRIEKQNESIALIGISNDINHRGNGYANKMIAIASDYFLKQNPEFSISAYIKIENKASEYAFKKAGFQLEKFLTYEANPSCHYIKKNENK